MAGVSRQQAVEHLRTLWQEKWETARYKMAKETFENENWCARHWLDRATNLGKTPMESLIASDGRVLKAASEMAQEARTFYASLYTETEEDNCGQDAPDAVAGSLSLATGGCGPDPAHVLNESGREKKPATVTVCTSPVTGRLRPTNETLVQRKLLSEVEEAFEAACEEPRATPVEIDVKEVKRIILRLKNKKCPGPDGLCNEFYKKYVNILGPALANVYREGLGKQDFGVDFLRGYITLICKDESKREHLEAWRPITLLNADLKILARILSNKLMTGVGHAVSEFQGAGVEGRNINRKLTEIRDILTWAEDRKVKGVLVAIDQEKAFDRIKHSYLFGELEKREWTVA